MTDSNTTLPVTPPPTPEAAAEAERLAAEKLAAAKLAEAKQRKTLLAIFGGALLILAVIVGLVILLWRSGPANTGQIRDIFIIFMAFESLLIGVTLVILMVQLATLINLLQNEIKPILDSTNETVNTLKGTATFIGTNLAEPIITLNQYMAGFKKLIDLVRPPK
jgi:NADH:ubiquinone oxidoreductase subunit K